MTKIYPFVFHSRQHQTELVPFNSTVTMQLDVSTHPFKALLSCRVSLLKKQLMQARLTTNSICECGDSEPPQILCMQSRLE
jgi:hypothetical protein